MWSRPTASVLSDGLRKAAEPCGPVKPAPSPSKLATRAAGGLLPGDVCSMAAEPGAAVMTGGTMGAGAWAAGSSAGLLPGGVCSMAAEPGAAVMTGGTMGAGACAPVSLSELLPGDVCSMAAEPGAAVMT